MAEGGQRVIPKEFYGKIKTIYDKTEQFICGEEEPQIIIESNQMVKIDIELGNVGINENGVLVRLPVGNIIRIEPFVWMGGLDAAMDRAILESRDIRRILALNDQPIVNNVGIRKKRGRTYKFIRCSDIPPENIISFLPECLLFIRDGQWNGEDVLVSCYSGASRSAAVVIAYLMMKYRITYCDARKVIDDKRPQLITINYAFFWQLDLFARMNYTIDVNNSEFRLFLFKRFISCIQPSARNQYQNSIPSQFFIDALVEYFCCLERAEDYGAVNSGRKYLCCNCNHQIFDEIDVIRTNSIETSHIFECKDIFIAPKLWMYGFVYKKPVIDSYGSIVCRFCAEKIGDYNISSNGFICLCPIHREFSYNPSDSEQIRESKYYCLLFKIDAINCKLESSKKCCLC